MKIIVLALLLLIVPTPIWASTSGVEVIEKCINRYSFIVVTSSRRSRGVKHITGVGVTQVFIVNRGSNYSFPPEPKRCEENNVNRPKSESFEEWPRGEWPRGKELEERPDS